MTRQIAFEPLPASVLLGVPGSIGFACPPSQDGGTDTKEKGCDDPIAERGNDVAEAWNVVVCGRVEIRHAPNAPNEDDDEREHESTPTLPETQKPRVDEREKEKKTLNDIICDVQKHGGKEKDTTELVFRSHAARDNA